MENKLKYPTHHWAGDDNPASSMDKYLSMHEGVYNQVKNKVILSLLPSKMDGLDMLDYGCGGGLFSVSSAKRLATVTGIDTSAQALEGAKSYAGQEGVLDRCHFVNATDIQGGPFDFILAKDVIEHVNEDVIWT